jgi:nitrogen fixation/metabolism regulation signal transduction histidine kinase
MVRIMAAAGDQPFGEAWRSAAIAQIPILAVMFLLLPVFLRDTLKMSNRFAGPMYRLRTALRMVSEKESCGPIKFRKGDFWQDAASDFNTMLGELQMLRDENQSLKSQLGQRQEQVEV